MVPPATTAQFVAKPDGPVQPTKGTMMKTLVNMKTLGAALFAGSALAMVAAFPASALTGVAEGDSLGMDEAAIIAALEGMSYTVEEVETEDGMIEVEVSTPEGLFEIEIDAQTGMVAEVEAEDEDDEDDNDEDDDADDEDDDDNETDNG